MVEAATHIWWRLQPGRAGIEQDCRCLPPYTPLMSLSDRRRSPSRVRVRVRVRVRARVRVRVRVKVRVGIIG